MRTTPLRPTKGNGAHVHRPETCGEPSVIMCDVFCVPRTVPNCIQQALSEVFYGFLRSCFATVLQEATGSWGLQCGAVWWVGPTIGPSGRCVAPMAAVLVLRTAERRVPGLLGGTPRWRCPCSTWGSYHVYHLLEGLRFLLVFRSRKKKTRKQNSWLFCFVFGTWRP